MTVDTVNSCSLLFPGDPGYFAGNFSIPTQQNVLWGDWQMVNSAQNFAFGDPLVAIEAAPGVGVTGGSAYPLFVPGDYTFYGRYVGGQAIDQREPLSTAFAARYVNGGAFSGGTDYIVWRDSKVNQGPFTCPARSGRPAWYPLATAQVVMFDEQEHPALPETCQVSPCNPAEFTPFPAETQRVSVGSAELQTPYSFGWTYLNLDQTNAASAGLFGLTSQAWVVDVMSSDGRFQTGQQAAQLDSACNPTTIHVGF